MPATSLIDLSGKRFGRWLVIARSVAKKSGHRQPSFWDCRCLCGAIRTISSADLRNGKTKSCGCLRANLQTTHGQCCGNKWSGTYASWMAMRNRCSNSRSKAYRHYGGRGIRVCRRWQKFENFFADMGKRPPGLTIERKNNNGNYCPSNCKWATKSEQCSNTRRSRILKCFGQTKTITQWGLLYGVNPITIHLRLKMGWSIKDSVSKPTRKYG